MTERRPVARINRPLRPREEPRRQRQQRVGLLGGSFNPAHAGHRAISIEALRRLRLDRVWWLVSPQNPLKPARGMASFADRFAAAKSVARHPKIVVSDIEQQLGTRYSIEVIRCLQRSCRVRFIWLMGADILLELPRWRAWQELVERLPIAVFDRQPYAYRALRSRMAQRYRRERRAERTAPALVEREAPAWIYLHSRRRDESSTGIRQQRRIAPRPAGQKEEASF
jgi:nicotinate-nucleotide adenylyltransferase